MTDCRTVPPWKRRAAPEATAAICSARAAGSSSLDAMGRPSAETRIACETPGVSVANFVTSQSYWPVCWVTASVWNIGFLSGGFVRVLGACGVHARLVAVQTAADGFWVAALSSGGLRGRAGVLSRVRHEVATGATHRQPGGRRRIHLFSIRCREPR